MYGILKKISKYELDKVICLMPGCGKLLEIGSGVGWQAKRFADVSYEVEAVDLKDSRYRDVRVCPVREYDGHHLPLPEKSFDIVFSSSVLEHIPHLELYKTEIHRVLKPGGKVVHVVPSATWRLWTSLAHYPYLIKMMFLVGYNIFLRRVAGRILVSVRQPDIQEW
jgi:ubiquinone/menaquinone biosynthesis C-methylase UbiE